MRRCPSCVVSPRGFDDSERGRSQQVFSRHRHPRDRQLAEPRKEVMLFRFKEAASGYQLVEVHKLGAAR